MANILLSPKTSSLMKLSFSLDNVLFQNIEIRIQELSFPLKMSKHILRFENCVESNF
jgi:hypothetical protein